MSPKDPAASPPPQLSAESVRLAVNRWSQSGFFRIRSMGDRMAVHEVAARAAHTVRLWSQYEQRTVSRASRPYPGGHVDDRGTPPDPWDIEVHRPTDFENRTEQRPVPHTEQVETCRGCNG